MSILNRVVILLKGLRYAFKSTLGDAMRYYSELPLGYCNVGRLVAVANGLTESQVGDRVTRNGNHAEYVCVPKNLVAKTLDNVTDEQTAFTVIGSIGLEGGVADHRLKNKEFFYFIKDRMA